MWRRGQRGGIEGLLASMDRQRLSGRMNVQAVESASSQSCSSGEGLVLHGCMETPSAVVSQFVNVSSWGGCLCFITALARASAHLVALFVHASCSKAFSAHEVALVGKVGDEACDDWA